MNTSPNFEIAFLLNGVTGLYVVTCMICVDGIFLTFCGYIAAQYEIIQMDFKKLIELHITRPNSSSKDMCDQIQHKKVLEALIEIVKKHNRTIELNKKCSQMFALNILFHFIIAAAHMGAIGVSMMYTKDKVEIAIYVFFIGMDLTQLYIYCYGGTLIIVNVC